MYDKKFIKKLVKKYERKAGISLMLYQETGNQKHERIAEEAEVIAAALSALLEAYPQETRWTKLKKEYPTLNDNEKTQLCVCALGYKCDCDLNCAKHWDVPVDEENEKE